MFGICDRKYSVKEIKIEIKKINTRELIWFG